MVAEPAPLDRRQRRRLQTIEEVLDVALEVMAEQGVAGLSVGEVARRMGIRPPSLYVYFPSKHALYDALFARGARSILDTVRASGLLAVRAGVPLEQQLLDVADVFVRWAVEHQAYAQLLFWRPVPGFTPSPEAYAPAVELSQLSTDRLAQLQQQGLIGSDVPVDEIYRDLTIVTSGVISQQLSNAPQEPFDGGAFTARLPALIAMFAQTHAPDQPHRKDPP